MKRTAAILFILLSLAVSVCPQTTSEIFPLKFGETVERELAPQTRHSYKVRLEAGQFAKFEAAQKGCDVVFMLVASDGSNLLEIKNEVEGEGVEITSVGIEKTDDYELRIISFGKNTGSYSLKFSELRPATEKEINFTSGQWLFNKAFNLQNLNVEAETLRKSVAIYEEAAEKFKAAAAFRQYASAKGNIGNTYLRLGNPQKSLEYYQIQIHYSRLAKDKYGEASGLNGVGGAYINLGKWQKALEIFNETLLLRRENQDKRGEGITLNNVGVLYQKMDDAQQAESHHLRALQLFEEIEDKSSQVITFNHLGKVKFQQNKPQEALGFFQKAVDLGKSLQNQRNQLAFLNNLGRTYFAIGNTAKSLEILGQSLQLADNAQDKVNQAVTLRHLGNVYLATEDLTNAETSLEKSLAIYRQIEDPTQLAATLFSLAKVKKKVGKLEEAQTILEEALKLIESFRSSLNTNELRENFSSTIYDHYSSYAELLMERHAQEPTKGFDKLAWLASERGRARTLLNLLNESNANIYEGVDKDLLAQEREVYGLLNARLENLTRVLGGKNTPKQVESLKKETEEIKANYQAIQAKIRENSPRYAALTQPQVVSIEEVQKNLFDANTALLSYSLGTEKSFLWFVTKDKSQVFELPKRSEIETQARQTYELLTARNLKIKFETADEKSKRIANADAELGKISTELSQILLGSIGNSLAGKKLIIVADGALQYIPFAALKNKNRYLIETNEIVYLPSTSTLSLLRRDSGNKKSAEKTAIVLADPVFDVKDERYTLAKSKTLANPKAVATRNVEFEDISRSLNAVEEGEISIPRLPFTRKEAETIAKLAPSNQTKVALDFASTKQLALSEELNQYRIIHFATHGFLNNKNPELSGLVFSLIDENGNPLNGFLRTDEVFNMKLSADLVVLSGCKTGLGKDVRGEGLIGLTRGFMYAGASRMMVSLWDINDEATAELMSQFYKNLLGKKMKPAQALREAQLTFLKDKRFSNPYFAMAFTIHGEF